MNSIIILLSHVIKIARRSDREMKYVLLLTLLELVCVYGAMAVTKRQNFDPSELACLQAYSELTTSDETCLDFNDEDSDDDDLLSPGDLARVCSSDFCLNVAIRVVDACKVRMLSDT